MGSTPGQSDSLGMKFRFLNSSPGDVRMGMGGWLQFKYGGKESSVGKVTLNSLTAVSSQPSTMPDPPILGTQYLLDK